MNRLMAKVFGVGKYWNGVPQFRGVYDLEIFANKIAVSGHKVVKAETLEDTYFIYKDGNNVGYYEVATC